MLEFIKASKSDIPAIQKLARDIWTVSYREMLSNEQLEYMLNWMYAADTIEKEMDNNVLWELIVYYGEIIGYIGATPETKALKLNKLYLLPGIQGKGLGQQSLAHVIEYARTNNFETVYLTVNQRNNNAIKAYEKAGFIRKEFKVFDIGNGYIMDDYIYEKTV